MYKNLISTSPSCKSFYEFIMQGSPPPKNVWTRGNEHLMEALKEAIPSLNALIVQVEKQPRVYFSPSCLKDQQTLTAMCSKEVAWIFYGEVKYEEKETEIHVHGLFVPEQEVSSGHADITEKGMTAALLEIDTAGFDVVGHGHSHVDLPRGTAPSSTDEDQFHEFVFESMYREFVRVITHKKEGMRVDVAWVAAEGIGPSIAENMLWEPGAFGNQHGSSDKYWKAIVEANCSCASVYNYGSVGHYKNWITPGNNLVKKLGGSSDPSLVLDSSAPQPKMRDHVPYAQKIRNPYRNYLSTAITVT